MATIPTLSATQVYPPLPTMAELIAKEVAKMDEITSIKILAGFDHVIKGKEYHFSYKLDDQINFSQMNTAATLALAGGGAVPGIGPDMQISWQGHADGTAYTLILTPAEYLGLSNAGGEHNKAMLAAGWVVKSALRACTTEEELKAKVAELELDKMHREAMDLKDQLGL